MDRSPPAAATRSPILRPSTVTDTTKTASLDGRKRYRRRPARCGQCVDADKPDVKGRAAGDSDTMIEPTMDVDNVARAIVYMAGCRSTRRPIHDRDGHQDAVRGTRLVRKKNAVEDRVFSIRPLRSASCKPSCRRLEFALPQRGSSLGCVSLRIIFLHQHRHARRSRLARRALSMSSTGMASSAKTVPVVGDFGKAAPIKIRSVTAPPS